jgi:putative flippase GtrA
MHKIIRYVGAGAVGAVTNLVVFYVLIDMFSFWYVAASICSFLAALGVSFTVQKFFTFRDRSTDAMMKQMSLFAIVALFSLLLNVAILYFLVDIVGLYHLAGQILTMIIVAVFSFVMYERFIFREEVTLEQRVDL